MANWKCRCLYERPYALTTITIANGATLGYLHTGRPGYCTDELLADVERERLLHTDCGLPIPVNGAIVCEC